MMIKYFRSGRFSAVLSILLLLSIFSVSGVTAEELLPRIPVAKNSPSTLVSDAVSYQKIVIKFKEGTGIRSDISGLSPVATAPDLESSQGINEPDLGRQVNMLNQYARSLGLSFSTLFDLEEQALTSLKKRGEQRTGQQLADLNLYFELPVAGLTRSQIQQIVDYLNGFTSVEISYAQPTPQLASLTPDFQDYDPANSAYQGYLESAEEQGIDAKYAWTFSGGRGESVKVVDIEGAWQLSHEDMPAMFFQAGTLKTDLVWLNHGTAVTGVIAGIDNDFGITGIAPDVQLGYSSIGGQTTSQAITAAAQALDEGDIILIELHAEGPQYQESCSSNGSQCNFIAMEYWSANFDAIQTATANGIIVVEAAGNGSANLDAAVYGGAFDRSVRDSGAILVAAGSSHSRSPMSWTNYGSRIDVHGWGENVTTMGYGYLYKNQDDPENQNYWYTATFNGTSSASPVVVGAAAALQGASKANNGVTLTPAQIRSILATTGTPQETTLEKKIGPLPDLKAAFDSIIELEPPQCVEYSATNSEHESQGRAYSETSTTGQICWGTFCWGGTTTTTWYVTGTGESLGTDGALVTVISEIPGQGYVKGACPTPDITAPVITILGDNPLQVYQGSSFVDPGVSAIDDRDGDISDQVVVTGTVNTALTGIYALTYNVSDEAGNSADPVTRTVNVVSAPACVEYTTTVSAHENASRAYSQTAAGWWWNPGVTTWYAVGSGENLGTSGSATVTLIEQPAGSGSYVQGTCPEDPRPPVIESYEITRLDYYQLIITGTASDPDNDISQVVLGLGAASGIFCDGTTNFSCELDFEVYGFATGGELSLTLGVYDSLDNRGSTDPFLIVRPDNQAPVFENFDYQMSWLDMDVSGVVSDADGDVTLVQLVYADMVGVLDCTGTTSFSCDLDNHPTGTYSFKLLAVDAQDNMTESAAFEVTFAESVDHPPVIDSMSFEVNDTTLLVTGTASDEDGDLLSVILSGSGLPAPLTCEGTGSFSCSVSGLAPGDYDLVVTAYDAADNSSLPEGPISFTIQEQQLECVTDTNANHGAAGRATLMYNILYYANGSNQYLGLGTMTSTIQETTNGYWEVVSSCP